MGKLKVMKFVLTALLTIGITISCFNSKAFAATAESGTKSVTVYGYTYTHYSFIEVTSDYVLGLGVVDAAGGNVPTGYFGVKGNLYNNFGSLVGAGSWKYNDIPMTGMSASSGKLNVKGTFYSKANVTFYNGNGYTDYTSNASPYLVRSLVPVSTIPNEAYEVNQNGLTYGIDYYAVSIEDSPDLIKAIGKNGVEGYIYSKDLNLELDSLDKVIDYINSGQQNYSIPVYDKDGTIILDTFEVVNEEM